jgi:hypothetical protein
LALKIYRFGEYTIKILETEDEVKATPLEGFRSLCPNNLGKPQAVEIIGRDVTKCEKEWAFCHLVNSIEQTYKLILEEVK